jgi:uncharacterized protein (DUF362 family)
MKPTQTVGTVGICNTSVGGYSGDIPGVVRDAVLAGSEGLGLGRWISPSDAVVILPNHVMHRRDDESAAQFDAKVTHHSVLGSVIDLTLAALGPNGRIVVGNSPLQGCDYSRLRDDAGITTLEDRLHQAVETRVEFKDFRTVKSEWGFGVLKRIWTDTSEQLVEIDLGADSWLEPLYGKTEPRFRVGDYDPEAMQRYHGRGRHVYAVNRRLLDANVILSVPKLKTHQKVGLTCGLKGCVGIVAKKECLAHHRLGGEREGGDEFAGRSLVQSLVARYADTFSRPNTSRLFNAGRFTSKVAYRLASSPSDHTMGGAWFGNDTAWRMTLDLARILRYADSEGRMHSSPVRNHLVLIDGIVGGEGNGPLRPEPVDSRLVIFGCDPVIADVAAAMTMGFEPSVIPLLVHALDRSTKWPVTDFSRDEIRFAGSAAPVPSPRPFEPSRGWRQVLGSYV